MEYSQDFCNLPDSLYIIYHVLYRVHNIPYIITACAFEPGFSYFNSKMTNAENLSALILHMYFIFELMWLSSINNNTLGDPTEDSFAVSPR